MAYVPACVVQKKIVENIVGVVYTCDCWLDIDPFSGTLVIKHNYPETIYTEFEGDEDVLLGDAPEWVEAKVELPNCSRLVTVTYARTKLVAGSDKIPTVYYELESVD